MTATGGKGTAVLAAGKGKEDFEQVKIEDAFVEPESFYTRLNAVESRKRKLVLVRLPRDIEGSDLDGVSFRVPWKRSVLAEIRKGNIHYQLARSKEKAGVGLALPGVAGLAIRQVLEEVWTVTQMPSAPSADVGVPLDYDRDVGGQGQVYAQPAGLTRTLSPMDYGTLIRRRKQRGERPATDDNLAVAAAPEKKSKKKKSENK